MRPKLTFLSAAIVLAAFATEALAGKSVLRLRLDGPLLEAPAPDAELAVLLGGREPETLHNVVKKIQKAAGDRDIHGIAIIVESPTLRFAQLEELTRALKQFREQGKRVFVYMDYAGNGPYALACAADHVTLAEHSMLDIAGLYAEIDFYKGLLDKIGVTADMMHCGDYKAALEPYTRTEPTKEFAENLNWLFDGIFERWVELIAEGRGLSIEDARAAVDSSPVQAEDALKKKLVDAVGSFGDFSKLIQKEFGKDVEIVKKYPRKEGLDLDMDTSNPFAVWAKAMKAFEEMFGGADDEDKPGIGLIYVDGAIVVGESEQSLFGGNVAGSTSVRAAFAKAAADDNIKAVVLRVDSPGGSALASDIIWKAARQCAAEKPLIVSMGGVAGSGGYYVAIPGDVIFAEASTITGSIGVVGGKLVWNDLMEDKLGITTTEISRGARAGMWSMNRVWSDEERKVVRKLLDTVYEQFKGRVTESRGDRLKGELESMAGGRVFTGRQALERGLVDRLGGLSDAIAFAADKASLKDYEVYTLPKKKEFFDVLKELMGEETEDEWEISLGAAARGPLARWQADPLARTLSGALERFAPQRLRALSNGLEHLLTLEREHVGCFMPYECSIR